MDDKAIQLHPLEQQIDGQYRKDGKPRTLRPAQQAIVDWEKNPPSAPSMELIKELFDVALSRGRPAFYNSREEFAERVLEYFQRRLVVLYDDNGEVVGSKWSERLTLSGLALHLHMHRSTLVAYGNKDEYSDIVMRAREIIQNASETALFENKNPAGVIFVLKNGFGWRDSQDITVTPAMPMGERKENEDIEAYAQRLKNNVPD